MDSFAQIKWPDDLERRDAGPPAGRGIFVKRDIGGDVCVALYWGHLVDDKGLIQVSDTS